MDELHIAYIAKLGWRVINKDPFSIVHIDGGIAVGIAADIVIDSIRLPDIIAELYHPQINLTCIELKHQHNMPTTFEHAKGEAVRGFYKPMEYYDKVRVGDLWVENGHWWGRREIDGLRVLATSSLIRCDISLWEEKRRLENSYVCKKDCDDYLDEIPF